MEIDNWEEGHKRLNESWRELQYRTLRAKHVSQQRQQRMLDTLQRETDGRTGAVIPLRHALRKEIFHGRVSQEGCNIVFTPEST